MKDRFKIKVWDTVIPNGPMMHDWEYVKTWPMFMMFHEGIFPRQCTGKHDANGKLIYEGDALYALRTDDETNPSVYVVEFLNGRWILINRITCEISALYDLRGIDYEIIGNIYEAPELSIE